jgi:ketosteroid isomerase-like protein
VRVTFPNLPHHEDAVTAPCLTLLTAVATLLLPAHAASQKQSDVDAVNKVIDQYGATEDAMDMQAQARLMIADRVWVAQGGGRRTDQATNMRIQQAGFDAFKKLIPGVQRFTEDRDRVIRFHGKGSVAVASFYRYVTVVVPPNTPAEVARTTANIPAAVVTLVLEKRDDDWKIVHTHISVLAQQN